jgi:uncharacterized protein (TIGR03790 family)
MVELKQKEFSFWNVALLVIGVMLIFFQSQSQALEPKEILVIANGNVKTSIALAIYYLEKRQIPKENLIKVRIPESEVCTRTDYVIKIAIPVRNYLRQLDPMEKQIRCLVVMYGLPLRIDTPSSPKTQTGTGEAINKILNDKSSSLDSELTLLRLEEHYSIGGWLPNPYFLGFQGQQLEIKKEDVLMVSRLDAPTVQIVKRIIDDSIAAEKIGLDGKAYFDARWSDPGSNVKLSGYSYYDKSIHLAADLVKKSNLMPVILDDSQELFKENSCLNAALYCGWYSLAKYIDAFTWQRGAIGFHIASSECTTLKNANSQVWCKMLLEKGVAATLGPVGEPYIDTFTVPELFFGFLIQGHLTLVECYMVSTPYLSWKMALIGDPLYFPFRKIK